uniref:Ubiquitin-activating enzyme E1 C-terminal domain-containing protein n=1 Tax=Spongospora subterranea TaxID=70186 RepID=A0A0H5R847_9EUKA|eukprot:CRZ10293.1 hypothetical protein [Spongospora subterranea]
MVQHQSDNAQDAVVHSADYLDLYSRQIGAYGLELMSRLSQLQILICGVKGIGVETAKNVILAGPKQVVLYDPEPASIRDLQTNFYLTAEHVAQKTGRASACVNNLATLNPYVQVKVYTGALNSDIIKQFHVVVITSDMSREELTTINEICHSNSIKFIYGWTGGAVSSIFSDFGPSHIVTDPDGEPSRINVVQHISKTGVVTVVGNRHRLDDGDHVKFDELEDDLEKLNSVSMPDHPPSNVFQIKRMFGSSRGADGKSRSILLPDRFQLVDFPKLSADYSGSGMISQVKLPRSLNFRTFRESCVNPVTPEQFMGMAHMDMNKLLTSNRGAQLHFGRLALWRFCTMNNGNLPKLHDGQDAEQCVVFAKEIAQEHQAAESGSSLTVDSIDEDVIFNMALYAQAELPGFTAFVGGILAQECVKAAGKYMPLNQWLHHDALELITASPAPLTDKLLNDATQTRYDHQIAIFGREFQKRLSNQVWFLVGAGALGCEYIKEIALMGLGSGEKGYIHVTDMDRIEVSNLNRQFLFRRDNVGQSKSACATQAAFVMNNDLRFHTYEVAVGPDSEDVFDDEFWSSLDGVWNALDNVKARQYTDSMCVNFEKPLLESGTLGTKANCEIVVPFQTQSYSEQKEQEEDSIPMCTLRNFPHFTEHCIEWSRAQFSDWFSDIPSEFNSLVQNPDMFFKQLVKEGNSSVQLQSLRRLTVLLNEFKNGQLPSFQTAVKFACERFTEQFRDRINDLIYTFPQDYRKVDAESGADLGPFWTGEKRFPRSAEIDINNPLHIDFIAATSNLYAVIFNLPEVRDRDAVIAVVASQTIAPWKAPAKCNIQLEEGPPASPTDDSGEEETAELLALETSIRKLDLQKVPQLVPLEFEKDDDTNFHIDFITAGSNLRSWNYRIKEASRHTCKMIAGKIIPALATTTAMISGLVCLELYKVVLKLKSDQMSNANVNLAVNSFQSFAPLDAAKAKAQFDVIMCEEIKPVPDGFTVWDKVNIDVGDVTVDEFLAAVERIHFGVKIQLLFKKGITDSMISAGQGKALYNANIYLGAETKQRFASYRKRNLKSLYEELYGLLPSPKKRFVMLDAVVSDASGNSLVIPPIKYIFKL